MSLGDKSHDGITGGDGADLDTVTLILKNPSQVAEDHFETSVRRDMSVGGLKHRLGKEYPGNPAPDSITLVYGGKVLHEEGMILSSILPSDSASVAMHMVVKGAQRHEGGRANAPSRLPASASPRQYNGGTTTTAAAANSTASTSTGNSDSTAITTEYSRDSPSEDRMPDESNTELHREEEATPSTSGDMSGRVFRAAYQAALQTIMSEGSSSSLSGYVAGVQSQPGMAFLAPVITLPQPVSSTTPDNARGRSTEDRSEAPQQMNQYIMPLIPVAYALPGEGNAPGAQAMARRRRRADAAERDHVAALLRALRGRDVAPRQNGGDTEPRGEQDQPRRRQVQIRIHINMRILLQLAVLFFVVYQHCPPSRVVGLVSVALLFYFSSTAVGRRMLQRLYGYFNLHRAQEAPAPVPVEDRAEDDNLNDLPQQHPEDDTNNNPVGGGGHGAREDGEARGARQPGFLQEIQAFLAGFLTSLLPAADNRHHDNNPAVVQDVWRGQ